MKTETKELKAGQRFIATINGNKDVVGRIQIENDEVFLCQDVVTGKSCKNKLGYKSSYSIGRGTEYERKSNNVYDFKIVTYAEGDILVQGSNQRKIAFIHNNVMLLTNLEETSATGPYTVKTIEVAGWKLKDEPKEEKLIELTIQDISDGKGKGIPAHLIRIKE